MMLEICSPDGQSWHHEHSIKPLGGGRVIDWVREFENVVVMVDAKRAFLGLHERYRSISSDWRTTFEKNWAKAVGQAAEFWDAVRNGRVPLLRHCRNKRPLLLVVTLTDGDWRAGHLSVHAALKPYLPPGAAHIPFVIVSVDRLERIVSTWETATPDWLPDFLEEAVQIGATAATKTLTPTAHGKLAGTFEAVFAKLRATIDSEDAKAES